MKKEQIEARAEQDFKGLLFDFNNDENKLEDKIESLRYYAECLQLEFDKNKDWNDRIAAANEADRREVNIHGGNFH